MKKRAFNFAAGPATLPFEVLEASAAALLDFQGKGFGIAECSHRGKEFDAVLDETIARCRSLLQIPDTHDVLFLQGGATQQFALIPMNFLNGVADYVITGEWSKKAADTAKGIAPRQDAGDRRRANRLGSIAIRPAGPLTRTPPTCTSARTKPCTATVSSSGPSTRP